MTLSLSKKIKNINLADKHKWYNHLLVRHSMVPPEETCSDKVGHNHIHSVVVMGKKDADYSHCTQSPAKPVIPPESLWRIYQKERGKKKSSIHQKEQTIYQKIVFSSYEFQLLYQLVLMCQCDPTALLKAFLLFTTRCHHCINQQCHVSQANKNQDLIKNIATIW